MCSSCFHFSLPLLVSSHLKRQESTYVEHGTHPTRPQAFESSVLWISPLAYALPRRKTMAGRRWRAKADRLPYSSVYLPGYKLRGPS